MTLLRRTFAAGALALAVGPHLANAQQKPRIAHIATFYSDGNVRAVPTILRALERLGWIEGQNLIVDRFELSGDSLAQASTTAETLLRRGPDVVVCGGTIHAIAILAHSRTVPIIFTNINDPVQAGIVASLARPRGNATGLSGMSPDAVGKRLELLKELVPALTQVGYVAWADYPMLQTFFETLRSVGATVGIAVQPRPLREPENIERLMAAAQAQGDQGLVIQQDSLTSSYRNRIVAQAAALRLPCVYEQPDFVQAGGLVSYGAKLTDNFERAAALIDKILNGAKPADIPVEQPMRFEMWINLKTAKALGLTPPETIMIRATEVIE